MRRSQLLADARRVAEALWWDPACETCTTETRLPYAEHLMDDGSRGCAMLTAERLLALTDPDAIEPIPGGQATSNAAARLEEPRAGSQAAHVLDTIAFAYPVPMTDMEIFQRRPPMISEAEASTVRARRVSLVDAGWVYAVDELGVSPKGRRCIRWGLTAQAVERLL